MDYKFLKALNWLNWVLFMLGVIIKMTMKKVNFKDLIARKLQGDMDKLSIKYYESEVLEGQIEVRKIPLKRYMEIAEMYEDDDSLELMNHMIYECCPMFKEDLKEVMEAYGAAEPLDLPSLILEDQLNELKDLMDIINSFYGIDKIPDLVKN